MQGLLGACVTSHVATPVARDLVDVRAIEPSIRVDLRYAHADNFTGQAIYPSDARCLLRRAVAERLARVQRDLAARGLGLVAWDCYRPFTTQERFWALEPDERYVARPLRDHGRPLAGSKHNRGAAVDVALVDASGRVLPMPTGFDDFSAAAHRHSGAGGPVAEANAQGLEDAMRAAGFVPLPTEWWHFDDARWDAYELLDVPFDAP